MKLIVAKTNKTKGWFLEKLNKIDKSLARPIKKIERLKSIKLKMKKESYQTTQKYKRS